MYFNSLMSCSAAGVLTASDLTLNKALSPENIAAIRAINECSV
jgi:hypothetical protein